MTTTWNRGRVMMVYLVDELEIGSNDTTTELCKTSLQEATDYALECADHAFPPIGIWEFHGALVAIAYKGNLYSRFQPEESEVE